MGTRGRMVFYSPEGRLYTSTEFNGDMYFSGKGMQAFRFLWRVHTFLDYEKAVIKFNREGYGYETNLIREIYPPKIDFRGKAYFKNWSEYVYFRNVSKTKISCFDRDGNIMTIPPDSLVVIRSGKLVEPFSPVRENGNIFKKIGRIFSK